MEVKVKKLHPDAILPTRATEGSACWDVYSLKDTQLFYMNTTIVPTGLSLEIPEGYFLDIRPRSGLAFDKSISLVNSPGTLDSDYRGELLIGLFLYKLGFINSPDIRLRAGQRVAQIRLEKVIDIKFKEVEELTETVRGEGGFGSTGK